MTEDLAYKIIVDDEIIDLRNENLQKEIVRSGAASRCSSQIKYSKKKKTFGEIHAAVLQKVANQMNITNNMNSRGRTLNNVSINKVKPRGISADPRFRRVRSPARSVAEKKIIVCRSELNAPHLIKNSTIYTKSESTLEKFENKDVATNVKLKDSLIKLEEVNPINQTHCEASMGNHHQVKREANKIDESAIRLHVAAETHFPTAKSDLIKDIEREWKDTKMHSDYLKNICMSSFKPVKSTWTLPVCNSMCKKCCGKRIPKSTVNTYKFDTYTDEDTSTYDKPLKSEILTRCIFTQLFILGIGLGLFLVAAVIWLFAGDYFWNLLNPEDETKCSGFQTFITYIAGSVLYGIDISFQKVFTLLSLKRNEFMSTQVEEPPESWFSFFTKYI